MNHNPFSREQLQELTARVVDLSVETGNWMRDEVTDEAAASIKWHNNLVTHVDHESERRFMEGLHTLIPGAGFIAEETMQHNVPEGLNWVIDPLDGTTNFVHSVPVWCTSVALCVGRHPVIGVIYDPSSGECFHGFEGGGAFCGTAAIHVSKINTMPQALLATGFPYHDFGRQDEYIALFRQLMRDTRGMRRLGSAALDMAWVACGRFEGFYEYGLSPWDVAAGTLLIREAGGEVTGFSEGGDPVFGRDILATNGATHAALLDTIARFF